MAFLIFRLLPPTCLVVAILGSIEQSLNIFFASNFPRRNSSLFQSWCIDELQSTIKSILTMTITQIFILILSGKLRLSFLHKLKLLGELDLIDGRLSQQNTGTLMLSASNSKL